MRQCTQCGWKLPDDAVTCTHCHAEYRLVFGAQSMTFGACGVFGGLALSIPFREPLILAVGVAIGAFLLMRFRVMSWVRR